MKNDKYITVDEVKENNKIKNISISKSKEASSLVSPALTIKPTNSLNQKTWAKLYYIVSQMIKKVSDSVESDLVVDIIESDNPQTECKFSSDGYHETSAVVMGGSKTILNVCIHCGSFSKRSKLSEKELDKHFKKMNN